MNDKVTKVSSGPLSGLLKVRYKVISTILGEIYDAPNGLDIFIDFNTLIHSLSKNQKYLNYLPFAASGTDVEVDLISSILTTLNHWKNYAKKWDNVRIFGIMNSFTMEGIAEQKHLKSYMIPYVNQFHHQRFDQLTYYWNEAVKKCQVILKYVPNMYLINSDKFDSFVLPNVLCDYEATKIRDYDTTGRKRIVVSGNSLMSAYLIAPNTKFIYTIYRRNGMQQFTDPVMIVKSITKVDEEIVDTFVKNKVFYNLLNTIIGDFDRGIIGMTQMGITTFAYNLLRGVEQGKIQRDPKSVESVLPVVDKTFHDYVLKTYPLVDIDLHSAMVPQSSIEKVKSDMIDLLDIDGLRSLSIDGLNLLELL